MTEAATLDAILFGVWVVGGLFVAFYIGRVVGGSNAGSDLAAEGVTPGRDLTEEDREARIAGMKRQFKFYEDYRDAGPGRIVPYESEQTTRPKDSGGFIHLTQVGGQGFWSGVLNAWIIPAAFTDTVSRLFGMGASMPLLGWDPYLLSDNPGEEREDGLIHGVSDDGLEGLWEEVEHRADGLFEEGYSDRYRRDKRSSEMIEDVFRDKGGRGA